MATIVLYPSSQFDYLTSGRNESDARELFEAWTAAHHPALLERDTAIPRWETASYPPFNLERDIVIVPPCSESFWNQDWDKQTAECTIIRNTSHRDDIIRQIMIARNDESPNDDGQPLDEAPFEEDFINDCYAFAAARFLLSLLNRNSYYMNTPDEVRLKNLMNNAIKAARSGEPNSIQQALQSAFDEVAMAKDNYHPTQNYFIELTLVTKTTTGEPLRQLLHDAEQVNLFISSSVLATLPETQPETFAALKSAVEQKKVRFIVDDGVDDGVADTEPPPLTLLPILDVADRILAGLSLYRELLNVSPTVYGRLHTGLSPVLPQLLKLAEMKGAIHFAPLAGWQLPDKDQSKIVWQGTDNTSIDALLRYPIDPSKYLAFFELADQFSSQLNQDSVPTSVFALFPGQKSGWLDILRRMNRYTTGLGKFVNIEEYFSSTSYSGGMQHYGYEKYPVRALREPEQNPLSQNPISPNPISQNSISQWNNVYRESRERLVQSAMETLLTLLKHPIGDTPLVEQFVEAVIPGGDSGADGRRQTADGSREGGGREGSVAAPILLPSLLINPLSFTRRMFIEEIAVDVPPMGYAFVESRGETADGRRQTAAESATVLPEDGNKQNSAVRRLLSAISHPFTAKAKPAPVLARPATDDIGRGEKRNVYLLENRYFTAKFDAATGVLRSIFTNRSRYNQLSRQIACRHHQTYTVQCVDEIALTKATPEAGQLTMAGRLVFPEGELAARFTETITIRSQSRLLEFDLTLEPLIELDDDRWNSYLAVRYAWNDDTLELSGNLNDAVHLLPNHRHLHSPMMVDLRHETESLTFLSEGLPFHRRSGERQLDTLLMVKGESQKQFRLGVGVNIKNPMLVSHDFALGQEGFVFPVSSCPKNPSAWLFQIESHHIVALHWAPVLEEEKVAGYVVYLQEVAGRRGHFALRSFLPPVSASARNLQGQELKTFKVKEDAVLIDMHRYELLPLMVRTAE